MKKFKKILAAVVIAATVASIGATANATTSSSSSLYKPFPKGKEVQVLNYSSGKCKIALNRNEFWVDCLVTANKLPKYKGYYIFYSVEQQQRGKTLQMFNTNVHYKGNQVEIPFNLASYQHGTRKWLTPATYYVYVLCQPSAKKTKPTIQLCDFCFEVNEQGLTDINKYLGVDER